MQLKASRPVNEIIVHCTATPEGRHHTVQDIDKWHKDGRGWSGIGYHFVVYLDGSIHEGRDINKTGAHVAGRNTGTIGVVYVGGVTAEGAAKDTRTPEQKAALVSLIQSLLDANPTIEVISGHNQYANKACPCFDAQAEYKSLTDGSSPAPLGGDKFLMNTRSGNIRKDPFWGTVIRTYGRGTMMTGTGSVKGPWVEVVFPDGLRGWVHDTIIQEVESDT